MVKRAQIRAFSEAVAREFHPQKIVLFGSYAYGHPTEDSDVGLLLIMARTRDRGERMLVRIRQAVPRHFPLDLLVRTPVEVAKCLQWGDPFMRELLEKGSVMYEANDTWAGQKGGERLPSRLADSATAQGLARRSASGQHEDDSTGSQLGLQRLAMLRHGAGYWSLQSLGSQRPHRGALQTQPSGLQSPAGWDSRLYF